MVPRLIHQTWKDRNVPDRFRAAQASWTEAHPDWEYRFWVDEELDALVERRAPELLEQYRRYPETIQRVDAARYVMLREFGGMYVDLDVHCLRPVDGLRDHDVVLPRTTPFGLSNQFMMSVPGHDLFRRAVAGLPGAFRRWYRAPYPRHLRILASTGPLFLTGRFREYEREPLPRARIRILSLDEHGHGDPAQSYVRHLRGNTWAGWDTHLFNFVHDHWPWFVGGAAAAGAALIL